MLGWLPLSPREHYVWPGLESHPDPPNTDGFRGGCDARPSVAGLRCLWTT